MPLLRQRLDKDGHCEVAIIGAGITGSLAAQHLAANGHEVCIFDREKPGLGSTRASTAMLLWEIDRSLTELTDIYGFERAASVYKRSAAAVNGLSELIVASGYDCAFHPRRSLYLAGGEASLAEMIAEHRLRERAGLPGALLDHRMLLDEFELHREGALVSPGSAEADPVQLSQALLADAIARGARLYDAEVKSYAPGTTRTTIEFKDGRVIEADYVVLATGYVMPDFVRSDLHKIVSSWAMATPPQPPELLWRDGALIWEARKNYNYVRSTVDNRVIIGGEDEDNIVDPEVRDSMIPDKTKDLQQKLQALWPRASSSVECAWSGAFGTTSDGLPLIGPVRGFNNMYAAYGYGGNGITFSYLASRIIGELIAGGSRPWFEDFALDRDAVPVA